MSKELVRSATIEDFNAVLELQRKCYSAGDRLKYKFEECRKILKKNQKRQ